MTAQHKGNYLPSVVIRCNVTIWNCAIVGTFLCLHIFRGKSKVAEQHSLEFPYIAQGHWNCFSDLNHLSQWKEKKILEGIYKKTKQNNILLKPEKSMMIPLVMPVYIATNFILIKLGKLQFMGIRGMFQMQVFFFQSACLNEPCGMILKRSRSSW